jgi:hypothetical protein
MSVAGHPGKAPGDNEPGPESASADVALNLS